MKSTFEKMSNYFIFVNDKFNRFGMMFFLTNDHLTNLAPVEIGQNENSLQKTVSKDSIY